MKDKKLKMTQSCKNGTLIGSCFQLVSKAWGKLLEKAVVCVIAKTLASYMWYNEAKPRILSFQSDCRVGHC